MSVKEDGWRTFKVFPHEVTPPVGVPCVVCDEPIAVHDRGYLIPFNFSLEDFVPYHVDCFARHILGPANDLTDEERGG